jgi:putative flippase GtrA
VSANPHTKVVPLANGQKVSWPPNRKVWGGASITALAGAATTVLVWVLKKFGIDVPIDVATAIAMLIGGLLATIVYFATAYWITEPPTKVVTK